MIHQPEEVAIPNPILDFADAAETFPPIIIKQYKKQDLKNQHQYNLSMVIILKGKNVIGIAQIGSGKTLAFLYQL